MNIDYEELQSFKRMNLAEIIQSYGHELKKQGEGYITLCPFHEDTTPSLSINQKGEVWLWHCFGCNKGGTVIDFIMKREGITIGETYEKLRNLKGPSPIKSNKPQEPGKYELLRKVTDFYHKTFLEDKEAQEYIKSRGLGDPELYKTFKIGYVNGRMKKSLPLRGPVIRELKDTGILNEKGNEVFYRCIVVPLYDEDVNVVSLYGRDITGKRQTPHLYIKGPHKGLVNRQGAYSAERLILTESIIDALSLYHMGVRNVIPCYGTGGFTVDHLNVIREKEVKEIALAFDNDDAGREGAKSLGDKLLSEGVETVTGINLPEGVKDINDYLLSGKTKQNFDDLETQVKRQSKYKVSNEGATIIINRDSVEYRVKLDEGYYIKSMRVNIRLAIGDKGEYTIDVVDLYNPKSRRNYIKSINKRFFIEIKDLEKDLFKIIEEAEKLKERDGPDKNKETRKQELTECEREQAIKELRDPGLVDQIIRDLDTIGCVGEDMNKVLGYIVTVSRKLEQPLSMIIVSQSGAGKSNLADTLEKIIPKQDSVHLSRITPQALYYMGKESLNGKVLMIEEKEGSDQADYSIRVLQSKKILRQAVPVTDPRTGRRRTEINEVEGRVTVIETTTRTNLNPENTSRCFIVYLDEGEDQTKRIHEYQKLMKTVQGAEKRERHEQIMSKHRNMQRVLEPVLVHIPYVDHIKFPTKWLRVRRDHMKFLNLIEAVTFLYQYQREKKTSVRGIEYIESTSKDYRIAYGIAKDVIGDSLTELMKPERDFYNSLKQMAEEKEIKEFTRRDIREYTGFEDHVVRKLLSKLVELEYVLIVEGKNGVKYRYKINEEIEEAKEIIEGLTTPEELEKILEEDGVYV